jgi:predicted alpha/beta superfamily hydrolase
MKSIALPLAALSALAVTGAAPVYAQPAPRVGERIVLESKVLAEQRVLYVRTPAGYAAGEQRHPVLYLTDGETQFFHTVATIEFLARANRMPEMIVVAITNTDRTRDLTPTRASIDGRDFPTAGGAGNFLRFIETEVVPHVERTYRTQPFRVFAGHSFGGLFAMHAFLTKPDLFNAVIAVSPTLTWDDDLPVRRAKDFFSTQVPLKRTLVVTLGSEGPQMQAGFDALRRVLAQVRADGFAWEAVQFDDEDHGSVVLRSHYQGLRKVFDGWQLPRDTATGNYTGTLADVRAHYSRLSDRLGYTVKPSEATINLLGYGAMAQGRTTQALEFFEFNVREYPASANVYDSLGEGLEAAGRLEDALAHYEKAVAMGEKSGDSLLGAFRQHVDAARAKLGKRSSSQE